jgi:hypothetical protein
VPNRKTLGKRISATFEEELRRFSLVLEVDDFAIALVCEHRCRGCGAVDAVLSESAWVSLLTACWIFFRQ